jgi:hypothetical protein
MKKSTTRIIIGLSVFMLALTLAYTAPQAHAATGGQALEIGPPILNLSANPGQTIKANLSLRDISGGDLIVSNQINDFVAGGEDGTPKIILDTTVTSPYSIREWITPLPQLVLKSHEIRLIPVTISVPKNASPGGYYGVVRFTGTPPDVKGSGVSLSASLGALILLKVNGVAKESLTIEQFFANDGGNPGSLFEAAPIKFVTRLTNSGNIHEEPAGLVTITDMFNNTVATLPVNQPPHDILPGSIRRFEDSVLDSSNIGNKILFGLYHAKLDITYGADKKTATTEIRFWVIPYKAILGIVLGLVLLFFGFRYFIRRYNRLIIERAKNSK